MLQWVSNPRPMAHKTIALTAELREPLRQFSKLTQPTSVDVSHPGQGTRLAAPSSAEASFPAPRAACAIGPDVAR